MNQAWDFSHLFDKSLQAVSSLRARLSGAEDLRPLLTSSLTPRADIEFTTRCNLSCIYCVSGLPSYCGIDLDTAHLPAVVQILKQRNALTVGVSGHGETTVLKDWHLFCDHLLDSGLDLYLSTNLSRQLTDSEIDTLSRFHVIQVSCDTVDEQLFKELRRGGDFRTLLYNIHRIRARAIRRNGRMPAFWWHCVVSDRTVWKLEEHVSVGLSAGVRLFNFINLVKHPGLEKANINLITDLPREDLERLPAHFSRIFSLIRKNRASYICDSLLERLTEKLDEQIGDAQPTRGRHHAVQKEGQTRDCLDPWIYFKVAVNGSILPCCRTTEPIGSLDSGLGIMEMLNNAKMKELRRSLLDGDVQDICRTCNIRGWTDTSILRFKIWLFSRFGSLLPSVHKSGLLLPLFEELRRRQ